jgi:hypothetical protein
VLKHYNVLMRKHLVFVIGLLLISPILATALDASTEAAPRNLLEPSQTVTAFAPVSGSSFVAAVMDEGDSYPQMSTYTIGASGAVAVSIWRPDWDMGADGWEPGEGPTTFLSASPDGQWLCYDLWAELPEDVEINFEHMRSAELVMLSRPDGSEARPIAVTIQVGGGPQFDFTSDSAWLVGQPFLACRPTPESYARYLNNDWSDPQVPEFNYYDLGTDEYGWIDDVATGDGYWKCPYSDNFRIENNWYAQHQFSNFKTGGILGSWASPEEADAPVSGWVLQDAVLLNGETFAGLLYVDGTTVPAPGHGWEAYCWLPDGSCLFSDDGGATVKYGKVDWTTFSVDWSVDRPDLVDYVNHTMLPLRDSSGVLMSQWGGGELLYSPVSRAGSKP